MLAQSTRRLQTIDGSRANDRFQPWRPTERSISKGVLCETRSGGRANRRQIPQPINTPVRIGHHAITLESLMVKMSAEYSGKIRLQSNPYRNREQCSARLIGRCLKTSKINAIRSSKYRHSESRQLHFLMQVRLDCTRYPHRRPATMK